MSLLVESALKVSVILLAALIAGALLTTRSASLRHWVLAVALGCTATTPLLSALLPASWIALPGSVSFVQSGGGMSPVVSSDARVEHSASNDRGVQTQFSVGPLSKAPLTGVSALALARGLWFAGAALGGLILLAGLGRLFWLARRARVIDSGPWFDAGEALRLSYGLSPVRLLQSNHPSLLITWGWHRPKVMLPANASEWAADRINIVLAHELAHIARGDWAVQLVAEALRCVYWFNPLLWITCRRLRVESERACDDAVLARGVEGAEYATHLLDVVRSLRTNGRPWLPAPAMARSSSLEGRISAMLNNRINRRPVSWSGRLATLIALVALTIPVGGLRAQSSFYSFTGTVLDATNRVLPDTRLILTNATSKAKYEVRSDAVGRFEFVGLPPAQYTLEASLPGFATLKEELGIEGRTERQLMLKVGSLEETITVRNGGVPPAKPDASTAATLEEARQKAVEFVERQRATCVAGITQASVGGKILPPRKLVDVKPIYPDQLKAANVGGVVTMEAVIGTDGAVREVRTVKGPHPDLEAAAVEAVRQWQFTTTLLNCDPIEVAMHVTVNFQ
jgi:TonB family protein